MCLADFSPVRAIGPVFNNLQLYKIYFLINRDFATGYVTHLIISPTAATNTEES